MCIGLEPGTRSFPAIYICFMSDNDVNNTQTVQERMFILFSVKDDARFLSHRETQTIWQRAFIRADIPICYSQGFNPHIKMSLPLPRNVGVASDCELLVFHVSDSQKTMALIDSLAGQLPVGITLDKAGHLSGKAKAIPSEVKYDLIPYDSISQEVLCKSIETLNDAKEYIAEREARGRHKARKLNIKDNIKELIYRENTITLTMEISPGVTARLDEIVKALDLDMIEDIEYVVRTATRYEETINDVLSL